MGIPGIIKSGLECWPEFSVKKVRSFADQKIGRNVQRNENFSEGVSFGRRCIFPDQRIGRFKGLSGPAGFCNHIGIDCIACVPEVRKIYQTQGGGIFSKHAACIHIFFAFSKPLFHAGPKFFKRLACY